MMRGARKGEEKEKKSAFAPMFYLKCFLVLNGRISRK